MFTKHETHPLKRKPRCHSKSHKSLGVLHTTRHVLIDEEHPNSCLRESTLPMLHTRFLSPPRTLSWTTCPGEGLQTAFSEEKWDSSFARKGFLEGATLCQRSQFDRTLISTWETCVGLCLVNLVKAQFDRHRNEIVSNTCIGDSTIHGSSKEKNKRSDHHQPRQIGTSPIHH